MRNLPPPSRDSDEADLKTAIRRYRYGGIERGHDITDDEIIEIIALYDRYEEVQGAARDDFKGDKLAASLRETIHAAYDKTQEGRTLFPIRELLFRNVELCPICGIGAADELDHHLPQSIFKPLAIHTRNLVPMCHACNHAKLAGFGDDELSGFLHPYYEVLPDLDFLRATVEIRDNGLSVSFAIDVSTALPEGYGDRLAGQFKSLDLDARYQREVNAYISSHAASLHLNYKQGGQAGVRAMLRLQARYETTAFHRNHWRPVLLKSLAAHDEFTGGSFAAVLPIPDDMLEDLEA